MKSQTHRTLAILSCLTPLLCATCTAIGISGLDAKDFSGYTRPRIIGYLVGRAIVSIWPLFIGIVLAVTALSGMRKHGRDGILKPSIAGLVINVFCLQVFIFGAFVGISEKADQIAASPLSGGPGPSAPAINKIVDNDYRFTFRLPGPGWQLLEGTPQEGMGPVSLGGAISPANMGCNITAEPVSFTDVNAYAQAVADSVNVQGKAVSPFQEMGFLGYKAIRFIAQGDSAGRLQRFSFLVFLREGFGFRLFSAPPPTLDEARWAADTQLFFDSFEPLPGAIKARENKTPVSDFIGIGYQFQQGVFTSVPGRFSIQLDADSGFQLLMPHQLGDINPDSEAGLATPDQSLSLVVIPEHILGTNPNDFRAQVKKRWDLTLQPSPAIPPLPVSIDGNTFELFAYSGAGQGVENRLGMVVVNSIAYQINAWYNSDRSQNAAALLPKALATIHLINTPDAENLERSLAGQGVDSEFYISADHSYRNGIYKHYARGMEWKHPRIGFARVFSGEQAHRRLPGAEMYIEDRSINLHGYTAFESMESSVLSPQDYHKNLVTNIIKGKENSNLKALPEIQWGEAKAQVSSFLAELGVLRLRYVLASAVLGRKGFSAVFWLPESIHEKSPHIAKALLEAISLSSQPFEESSQTPSAYIHHRLGFSIQIPKGYSFQDERAPSDGRNATRLAWIGSGDNSVRVLAVVVPEGRLGIEIAMRAMEQKFRDTMNARHPKRNATLGGLPCEVLTGNGVTTWFTARHNVIYGLVATSDDGRPELLAEGFKFLN